MYQAVQHDVCWFILLRRPCCSLDRVRRATAAGGEARQDHVIYSPHLPYVDVDMHNSTATGLDIEVKRL